MRTALLVLGLALTLPVAAAAEPPVARVAVNEVGGIALNGRPVALPELKTAFRSLSEQGGVVWYYRPNPAQEPPLHAMEVVQAIIEARLPVRLATKPDFSEFAQPPAAPQ